MSTWADCPLTYIHPTAKGGHAAAVVDTGAGHAIIVIGGSDPFGVAVNEVQRIDIPSDPTDRKFKCTTVQENTTQCPFLARMGHSAHSLGPAATKELLGALGGVGVEVPSMDQYCSPIVLFGGASMIPEPRAHDGVFLLFVIRNVDAEMAKPERERQRLVRWVDITPSLKGKLPLGRHAHSSCLTGFNQSHLLVAAGSTGEKLLNCFHVLDLATLTWSSVDSDSATKMPPREMAALWPIGEDALLIGGRDDNGVVRGDVWRFSRGSVRKEAKGIPSRCCHTILPSKAAGGLVAVGGFSSEGMPIEDVVVTMSGGALLSTTTAPRCVMEKEGEIHFGLGHSAVVEATSGRGFIVGGIHPNSVNSSMHMYELLL